MIRLGRAVAALVVVASAAALCAPGASAKTYVEPAQQFVFIFAPGTDGWHLQVATTIEAKRRAQNVTVALSGPRHQQVTYGVHGRTTEDGTIEAKLPGLGRISLRFEPVRERTSEFEGPQGCTGPPTSVERFGRFRGVIRFRGEGGYTTVRRRNARGEILENPREVCHESKHSTHPKHTSPALPPGLTDLIVG